MQRRVVVAAARLVLLAVGALLVDMVASAEGPRPGSGNTASGFRGWGAPWKNPDCTMTGPMTAGGPAPLLDAPAPEEVYRTLVISRLSNDLVQPTWDQWQHASMVLERMAEYTDPVRVYPLIGPARLHHAYYKCTITYNSAIDHSWRVPGRGLELPDRQVYYVDYRHLHQVGEAEAFAARVNNIAKWNRSRFNR